MVGRIRRAVDFQRVLSVRPCVRSAHFAAHHLFAEPLRPRGGQQALAPAELSTGSAPDCPPVVDDPDPAGPADHWLGLVVPKRFARRAVTRNLLKRQMRALMADVAQQLPPGLWVLRLKAGFDRALFRSPASDPLRRAARQELAVLLARAAALPGGGLATAGAAVPAPAKALPLSQALPASDSGPVP